MKVKTKLVIRLDVLEKRDYNNEFDDRQTTRSEATATERLATATANLADTTTQLARPDLTPTDRRRLEREQMTARHVKEALEGNEADEDAADAYLDEVLAEQVDVQVPVVRTAIADVQTRHDGLPA